MDRNTLTVTTAAALVAVSLGCGQKSAAPVSPTSPARSASAALTTADAAPPILTAPTAQTPVNGVVVSGLAATLTASAATINDPTLVLQYRFQLFGDGGTLVLDSGLVKTPTWTTNRTLTPNKRYTWKVRGEADGWLGPWSDTASFTTPDPPPAYAKPIGDWQSCASQTNKTNLVVCVWNTIRPVNSVGDMEVVKRVAWLLRGEGAGLLIKTSGDNIILWQGYSLSCARICYPDGHIYKLMQDAGPGGTNAPQFADNDFVDPALYVKAIDPSKP